MKVSEINDLNDLRSAIDKMDTKINYAKKSVTMDYENFKFQLQPTNIVSSICNGLGDRVTFLLLKLASRLLDK